MKKRTFAKNTWYDWYDWLVNYILDAINKTMGGVKDKIMRLFKINTTRDYSEAASVKNMDGGGKKLSEDNKQKTTCRECN